MLVLTRTVDQDVVIDGPQGVRIRVLKVKGKYVKLGIEAPRSMTVLRRELLDDDQAARESKGSAA